MQAYGANGIIQQNRDISKNGLQTIIFSSMHAIKQAKLTMFNRQFPL
jgi:hypothetical protein